MGFFKVPDDIFEWELSPYEIVVLVNLMRRANDTGESFPGLPKICEDTGIKDTRTVSKVVRSLEGAGWVNRFSKGIGRKTHYQLCPLICKLVGKKTNKSRNKKESSTPAREVGTPDAVRQIVTPANYACLPPHEMHSKEYPEKENPMSKESYTSSNTVANVTAKHDFSITKDEDIFYSTRKKRKTEPSSTLVEMNSYFQSLTTSQKEVFDRCALRLRLSSEPRPGLEGMRLLRCRYFEIVKVDVSIINTVIAIAASTNTPFVNGMEAGLGWIKVGVSPTLNVHP